MLVCWWYIVDDDVDDDDEKLKNTQEKKNKTYSKNKKKTQNKRIKNAFYFIVDICMMIVCQYVYFYLNCYSVLLFSAAATNDKFTHSVLLRVGHYTKARDNNKKFLFSFVVIMLVVAVIFTCSVVLYSLVVAVLASMFGEYVWLCKLLLALLPCYCFPFACFLPDCLSVRLPAIQPASQPCCFVLFVWMYVSFCGWLFCLSEWLPCLPACLLGC